MLLARYKMALNTTHKDLRTAVESATMVVALNEELTDKLAASEKKLKRVQEERQNAVTKLQEKLEEIKALRAAPTGKESKWIQEENVLLRSTVKSLHENVDQHCQEISILED